MWARAMAAGGILFATCGFLPVAAAGGDKARTRSHGRPLVGRSLILFDVAVATSQGERKVVLYVTDLGEPKSFGVHATAACPSPGSPDQEGPCEETYFAMLESTEPAK